ncbi:MAG: bifunctional aspartate kinase/homoserine dehydrogenase I [Saprospiraceae bacterium]|nr:bifunctional aspartate kinase/homoserine dehydrogenase I [Saprospiraceae bacterium]MCF8252435.1 bifunctional aspartate kinase/homoserine dehydrogenase I [Saprospiraceae bacterium]MCF8282282.1 bifunctional aspartate kinase/homoserine dehydrogenase I [Bacteroidales bacterium]MCF8314039.1 bifunctional aspartate kinase/homoserine dehydrogenase I [Saprospiraceae bacterium]MCF8442765.1 bifunctional aspartate kinase/homoserine dehydrogenase I [Saprospiraceae bacterium]
MKVLKFGGSSVGTPERINGLIEILKSYYSRGDHFTVVFSAFSGVTDSLLDMSSKAAAGDEGWRASFEGFAKRHQDAIAELVSGKEQAQIAADMERSHQSLANMLSGIFLVREASPRMMDYVVSFGERSSSFIIAAALRQAGIPASFLDARKVIRTNDAFQNAKVDFAVTNPLIKEYYAQHPDVQVVTGFIGATPEGITTTLGRGGSDYTAAIIAAGLDAAAIEIWTDVDGVLTADPRKVKKAFTIPKMTYAEAMEMSHFGAKVIYPPTLQPALQKRIPLFIKNTFNPGFEGTYITDKRDPSGHAVTGISSINKVAMLTLQGGGMFGVPGIAGRLFGSLASAGISVILITQGSSEHSITFAIPPEVAKKAKQQVAAEFEYEIEKGMVEPLKVEADLSVIAIIGENMRFRPGIAGRMFQALGKNGVNVVAIAQGSSELNISVVVAHADEAKAMNALHEAFFLSDTKELHVFMVGVGLIGATLIEQIREQSAFLKEKRSLELKIVGLTNSKTMLFEEDGIDLANWKTLLSASGEKANLPGFVERMKGLNLSNSIFVDNTASEEVPRFYEAILESSISISTPNKIATSSSYLQYQRLKGIAARRGVPFLYETNVGAGLPVIGTLEDLITSGDRILKIEGVLSGTMSFIFNKFKQGGEPFSAIVREAKQLGYTEPDPRDDLGGADVRRKLLILARETGLPLEAADVHIESILPKAAQDAPNVDAFFAELEKADAHFEKMAADAAADGKALRMVASLDKLTGQATIGLRAVDASHPFYSLSGSDNMIVFTTERYKERPLVVRGPGAGAAVTAAGVFAEVVRIGSYLGN